MGMESKKEGVIFALKRVSNKFFFCKILFSDSVLLSVFVLENRFCNLSVGLKVFGVLYVKNNEFYYKILDCDFFLGSFFWHKESCLNEFFCVILEIKNCVSENFQIQGLYEAFIESTKMVIKNDKRALIFIKKWLKNAIN